MINILNYNQKNSRIFNKSATKNIYFILKFEQTIFQILTKSSLKNMSEILKKHLEKFIQINEEEFLEIAAFFKTITVQKKENLLIEGAICKSHFFVLDGCLRKFLSTKKELNKQLNLL